MIELLVVLAEQVLPIIVAVRRANDRVNVVARRLLVPQRDAALVVELYKDHGAVDAIIKDALVVKAAHPRKVSISQMLFDLFHSDARVARSNVADICFDQAEQ